MRRGTAPFAVSAQRGIKPGVEYFHSGYLVDDGAEVFCLFAGGVQFFLGTLFGLYPLNRPDRYLYPYYAEDVRAGVLTRDEAQELIDDLIIKLRMVRFLRTHDYNALFSGDPTWVTEAIGGVGIDGRPLVTKSSFRFLHTLTNLGPAPEPNLTVLWSHLLPKGFKDYCAEQSIETSSIQYENDDLMRQYWGDDYSIACCVSAMRTGKQMQFFGARVNLGKALLYAINGGRDEMSGKQITTPFAPITANVLNYDEVMSRFEHVLDWLAGTYVNALNVIHYMHDRYAYERVETTPKRYVVDLKGATHLDSSALGMLLLLRDHAGGESAQVSLVHCNPDVRKVLAISNFEQLFKIS